MRPKMKKMTLGKRKFIFLRTGYLGIKKMFDFYAIFKMETYRDEKWSTPQKSYGQIYSERGKIFALETVFYVLEGSILSQRQVNNFE
jgi:hypothetical protein